MDIDTLNTCAGLLTEPRHRHCVLAPGTAEPGLARPGSIHPDQLGAIPPGLVKPILVALGLAKLIVVYYCRSSWRITLKTKTNKDIKRRK